MGERFEALRSLINQHILTPAQDPPQHAQCFETAEDFNNFLRSCPQLKRDMLSGYVRKVPQLRNKDDVSKYLEERGSYRGKTFSDKEVNDAFEKAFNHTNFMWTKMMVTIIDIRGRYMQRETYILSICIFMIL